MNLRLAWSRFQDRFLAEHFRAEARKAAAVRDAPPPPRNPTYRHDPTLPFFKRWLRGLADVWGSSALSMRRPAATVDYDGQIAAVERAKVLAELCGNGSLSGQLWRRLCELRNAQITAKAAEEARARQIEEQGLLRTECLELLQSAKSADDANAALVLLDTAAELAVRAEDSDLKYRVKLARLAARERGHEQRATR